MKMIVIVVIIVIMVAIPSGSLFAKTYFVSPNGDDLNDGSIDTPLQTLQFVAGLVKPGDTVEVLAGEYQGFDLRQSGEPDRPIIFRGHKGVVINSDNPKTKKDGINLEGASYIVIEGFDVTGVKRAGIRSVENRHVTIRNNKAYNNGVWGIFTGFSEDLVLENNETSGSVEQHGIYVSNSADRPTVRHNVAWGNAYSGIQFNADVSMGGDGIISNAVIENNIIYGNGKVGASALNCAGLQDSVIRNNLLYGNHASGISLYKGEGADGAINNLVVNNTVVQAQDGRWALNIQQGSTGNKVFNNILLSNHSFRGAIDISQDSLPGFESDYNILIDRFTLDGGDTNIKLKQWQEKTGQDLHSIVAKQAKVFKDADINDYSLIKTSPALDAGKYLDNVEVDITWQKRPFNDAYDIGCYEYVEEKASK